MRHRQIRLYIRMVLFCILSVIKYMLFVTAWFWKDVFDLDNLTDAMRGTYATYERKSKEGKIPSKQYL